MQAMVLEFPAPIGSNPLHLMELPPLLPGPGEMLVKVNYCGICRTDLHIVEGALPLVRLPLIPGHEVVGEVVELGPRTDRFRVGERVGISWLQWACGQCPLCRNGLENLCEKAQFTGFHKDGGYTQMMVAPAAFAYHLPENFSDLAAAPLLCSGIVGYRALKRSDIKPGGRLGIYGFGGSAHIAMQVARHWNCEVFVFTQRPGRQALAREQGASWVGRAQDTPPVALDSVVIFAPLAELVPEALRVLNKGGTLVLAVIHMSAIPPLDFDNYLGYEKTIRSVTASTRQDGEELFQLAASIPIRTRTQQFPLAEANKALQLLKAGEINGSGVLAVAQ
jgi:alcohol dehydrogenase, propanol-preferring